MAAALLPQVNTVYLMRHPHLYRKTYITFPRDTAKLQLSFAHVFTLGYWPSVRSRWRDIGQVLLFFGGGGGGGGGRGGAYRPRRSRGP